MVESLSNTADEADVDAEVEDHRQNETHATAQPPESHGNEAHAVDFATAGDAIDTRRAINQLVIQNAEQDFELGLEMLEYDDGQYAAYVDDSEVSSLTSTVLTPGTDIDNAGYVSLDNGLNEQIGLLNGYSPTMRDATFDYYLAYEEDEAILFDYTGSEIFSYDFGQLWNTGHIGSDNIYICEDDVSDIEQIDFTGSLSGTYAPPYNEVVTITSLGDYIYVNDAGNLFKIDKATMTETDDGSVSVTDFPPSPVIADGAIYARSDGYLVEIDPADLSIVNTSDAEQFAIGTGKLAVGTDYVYAESNGTFYKLDKTDLSVVQTTTHSKSFSNIAYYNDFLYLNEYVTGEGNYIQRYSTDFTRADGRYALNISPDRLITGDGEALAFVVENGNRYERVGIAAANSGDVTHTSKQFSAPPSAVVVNDELLDYDETDHNISYIIEDDMGNSETIQNRDTEVSLTSISGDTITITAKIERPSLKSGFPKIDSWAAYMSF